MNEEIILNNLKLIYKVMKDTNCMYASEEEQEEYYFAGLMGLINASKYYDEQKGKSGYLYRAIKSRILNCFYSKTLKKNSGKEISLNIHIFNDELQDLIVSNYNLEKDVINKVLIEELLTKLNKQYRAFVEEYYGINTINSSMKEIAKKYNVSSQYVQMSIHRALDILRKELK